MLRIACSLDRSARKRCALLAIRSAMRDELLGHRELAHAERGVAGAVDARAARALTFAAARAPVADRGRSGRDTVEVGGAGRLRAHLGDAAVVGRAGLARGALAVRVAAHHAGVAAAARALDGIAD